MQAHPNPLKAALIVVDVQNDVCSAEGATAKAGQSVKDCIDMIPQLSHLIKGARKYGVPIIFVQTIETWWTDSDAWSHRASEAPRVAACVEGTWGAQFFVVSPRDDEAVVVKPRDSAFYNTRLDSMLRTIRPDTLVIAGVTTNVSVEMTARDAAQRDYRVVVIEDCTAAYERALHEASLYNVRSFIGDVATSDAILNTWNRSAATLP